MLYSWTTPRSTVQRLAAKTSPSVPLTWTWTTRE
jgi:hypothetical protein